MKIDSTPDTEVDALKEPRFRSSKNFWLLNYTDQLKHNDHLRDNISVLVVVSIETFLADVPSVWSLGSCQPVHWPPWALHPHPTTHKHTVKQMPFDSTGQFRRDVASLTTAAGWEAGATWGTTKPAWGFSVAKAAQAKRFLIKTHRSSNNNNQLKSKRFRLNQRSI